MVSRRGPDPTRLAAASLAAGDPPGWFEQLYAEAGAGTAEVPWDVPRPSKLLAEWARDHEVTGSGRRALGAKGRDWGRVLLDPDDPPRRRYLVPLVGLRPAPPACPPPPCPGGARARPGAAPRPAFLPPPGGRPAAPPPPVGRPAGAASK